MKKRRERAKVTLGGSAVNAGDLESLRIAWRKKKLMLFLGAGVSTDLIRRMKRKGAHNGLDAGAAAQLEERVRAKLYATHRATDTNNPTLQAVANLIARSVPEQNLAGVVNFNFDNLLEQELTRRKISHSSIVSAVEIKRTGLTILHPHGFLPQTGKIDGCNLVFTEDEYHDLIESSFQWALTEIVHSLRHSTALFIGLSMSDPSLRRLLDASRESHDYPVHFQLLKRHVIQDSEEYQVLADVESRAQKIGKWLGMGEEKKPTQLREVIRAALAQADTYDRQLFESMKVKTIWLESYDDIPEILNAIAPEEPAATAPANVAPRSRLTNVRKEVAP